MKIYQSIINILKKENIVPKRMCELGVNRGFTTKKLIKYYKPEYYLAVDLFRKFDTPGFIQENTTQKEWDAIFEGLCAYSDSLEGTHLQLMREDTADCAMCYFDASFDFVFIDADHSYSGCLRDIDAWLPKVRKGGIIAGHDYSKKEDKQGVNKAVQERFKNYKKGRSLIWYALVH
jgi:hypothetical protein